MHIAGSFGPVLVLGPLFLDVVMGPLETMPEAGEEKWVSGCAFVAGGSANQAVALAKLGCETHLRSFIGTDEPGQMVRKLLLENGIKDDALVEISTQSVTTSISLGTDRAMVTCGTDEAPALDLLPVPSALIADLRAIGANRSVITQWKNSATPPMIIGDVGWDDSDKWDSQDLEPLDLVDYFVPNEGEALHYTGCSTVEEAALVLKQKCPNIVITRGAEGVYALGDTEEVRLPGVPVSPVDPTGAGDTFGAMLTWALLNGHSLHEAVSGAALAATKSVLTLGGSSSAATLDELADWLATYPIPSEYDAHFLIKRSHPINKG